VPRPPGPPGLPAAAAARGSRAAVVGPHHLATTAGLRVLDRGGSAVDAAIATNAALAVVVPSGCGLGGDAFWLVWDATDRRLYGLNGSGRAPAAASAERLRAAGLTEVPRRGPHSISVPGAVRSWSDAHARWGRLDRGTVLADAIELAESGFPAWDGFIDAVERTSLVADAVLGPTNAFRAVYRPHGRPWRPGETVRSPALARTLRRIAEEGFDTFYDGELGARQTSFLATLGAPFAVSDLRDHRSIWTEPITMTYRGKTVATHPPNSVGLTGLQLLGILDRLPAPAGVAFGPSGWSDPRWIHAGIEAAKLALADRDRGIADPATMPSAADRLLDPAYLDGLAARIDPRRAALDGPPVRLLVGGTVYLGTVDRDGWAVSLIESHSAGFGSTVVDPETGIHYHSRGASFSLEPGDPNELRAGRRPIHSLVPAMTFRQPLDTATGPWIVHGSMGGDAQPQILGQIASALIDGGADVASAVAAPRWGLEPDGGSLAVVDVETRFDDGVLASLEDLGHPLRRGGPYSGPGHAHAIELVDGGPAFGGSLAAATDPRSAGRPAVR
jgi:gamma-glutamyltranspeptidase/glutathione hydrolase